MVGMLKTPAVKAYLQMLKQAGCAVKLDTKTGTAEAFDGDAPVFRALQKGPGNPWIVRYQNSDRVTWNQPETPAGS
jgi:hypothetical protein